MRYADQIAAIVNQQKPEIAPTYGWRFWTQSPVTGGVVSIISILNRLTVNLEAATPMTPLLVARCPHGNTPPSANCSCGIHFVAGFSDFYEAVRTYYTSEPDLGALKFDRSLMVVSFGMATGPVVRDINPNEWWGGQRPWRSSGYRMLGMITEPENTNSRTLSRIYQVPVFNNGINSTEARRLESRVRG